MNDENALRIKAQEALRTGKLPPSRPKRMWGGPGSGARCTVCLEPVQEEELGFELEFDADEPGGAEGNHHIHLRCFAAWEFERRHFEPAASSVTRGEPDPSTKGGDEHKQATGAVILSESNNNGTMRVQNEGTHPAYQRDNSSRGGAA